ncbi:MAG TPA: two-component sensor histidine kinase, partial [Actinoplanes sp.]|nr:two-component sensor histidine kinase [Actinoplanes sp.]
MSSSPPTDLASRPARWRSPSGWSLRARLVAVMIALLVVLGLVVGGTAEIYLHKTLYDQVDAQLAETSMLTQNRPGGPGAEGGFRGSRPPPNVDEGTIILRLTTSVTEGGIVAFLASAEGFYDAQYNRVPEATVDQLAAVTPDNHPVDVDLGDLGDYRVLSVLAQSGNGVFITAMPLARTRHTLIAVAAVTGGAVLLALV